MLWDFFCNILRTLKSLVKAEGRECYPYFQRNGFTVESGWPVYDQIHSVELLWPQPWRTFIIQDHVICHNPAHGWQCQNNQRNDFPRREADSLARKMEKPSWKVK